MTKIIRNGQWVEIETGAEARQKKKDEAEQKRKDLTKFEEELTKFYMEFYGILSRNRNRR